MDKYFLKRIFLVLMIEKLGIGKRQECISINIYDLGYHEKKIFDDHPSDSWL